MSRADRLRSELDRLVEATGDGPTRDALLPQLVSRACVAALPVAGAGLSSGTRLRLPLAASSPDVRTAEALQTTVGDGPCLTAALEQRALSADEATIAARWPVYHQELLQRSTYRSTCSIPLDVPWPRRIVLDLYSTAPNEVAFADPEGLATDLAPTLVTALADSLELEPEQLEGPAWSPTHPVVDRMTVWTAIGMVMGTLDVPNESALALLRAHAYRTGASLDELAARLSDGRTRAEELAGD